MKGLISDYSIIKVLIGSNAGFEAGNSRGLDAMQHATEARQSPCHSSSSEIETPPAPASGPQSIPK
jgi:hypothetical protein